MSIKHLAIAIAVSIFGMAILFGCISRSAEASCLDAPVVLQDVKWEGSALHKAVLDMDVAKARKLLAADKSLLGAKDNIGQTALFYAVVMSAPPPPLRMNGSMTERDKKSQRAARQTEVARKTILIDILLGAGADATARDASGLTPLISAALRPLPYAGQNSPVIARLIKAGADVNAQDADGTTALMIAVIRSDARLKAQLLKAGANPDLKRCDGKSASQLER
jgi:ankyrin repeat protein